MQVKQKRVIDLKGKTTYVITENSKEDEVSKSKKSEAICTFIEKSQKFY